MAAHSEGIEEAAAFDFFCLARRAVETAPPAKYMSTPAAVPPSREAASRGWDRTAMLAPPGEGQEEAGQLGEESREVLQGPDSASAASACDGEPNAAPDEPSPTAKSSGCSFCP